MLNSPKSENKTMSEYLLFFMQFDFEILQKYTQIMLNYKIVNVNKIATGVVIT